MLDLKKVSRWSHNEKLARKNGKSRPFNETCWQLLQKRESLQVDYLPANSLSRQKVLSFFGTFCVPLKKFSQQLTSENKRDATAHQAGNKPALNRHNSRNRRTFDNTIQIFENV